MTKVKYCALTTISDSLKSFVLPSLRNLKKNDYDITVSCAKDDNFARMVRDEFNYFPLEITRGFHLSTTILNIFVLYKFFRKEKFELIEYGTENVALCAAVAGFFAGVPLRIYNHWGARYVGLSGIPRIMSIWIERFAALFSTDIRQVSFKNAEMCVKDHIYSAKKVKVLGNGGTIGVDFNQFKADKKGDYRKEVILQFDIPEDSFIFGFVGRIQPDKGVNELIAAFRKIYKENKNAYLMLVGLLDIENQIEEEKKCWAESCPNVIFTGLVADVHRYMSTFDTMVHPTYREGFGMVLQEAAAVKTPIITTNIMGPGEFIKNNVTGILVEAKNSEQLYDAMRIMMTNEALRKRYANQCYEYTKNNFERAVMVNAILQDRELLCAKYRRRLR
ncbi:glycosyltransferase [Hungatella hathewayi]